MSLIALCRCQISDSSLGWDWILFKREPDQELFVRVWTVRPYCSSRGEHSRQSTHSAGAGGPQEAAGEPAWSPATAPVEIRTRPENFSWHCRYRVVNAFFFLSAAMARVRATARVMVFLVSLSYILVTHFVRINISLLLLLYWRQPMQQIQHRIHTRFRRDVILMHFPQE